MNRRRAIGIAVAAALLWMGAGRRVRAQVLVAPPTGGGVMTAPPTETVPASPASGETRTQPAPSATLRSATSVLQEMLNGGTSPGVTEPALIVPGGPELGVNGLLREGQEIELRLGRLKKDEKGRMWFVFDARESPQYAPMEVIPSQRLAAMEDAADFVPGRTPKDMTFRITAEVTEYRGKNYLYIKPSAIPVPRAASVPGGRLSDGRGSAMAVGAPAPGVSAAAPNVPAAALLTEGSAISNRVGRLVRDPKTGAKLMAFDADGRRMADPPMGVVPCQSLTVLEDATQEGNKPVKFTVSGEVTTYRGKNYLYLKAVRVVPELGQGIGPGDNIGG